MKKYIFCYLIFLFPFLANVFAQTQPKHFEHWADECFSQSDYASENDVVAAYVKKNMGFTLCTGPCPFPPKSCQPLLLNQNTVVTTDNANNLYCINGQMKFKWKCNTVTPGTYDGGVIAVFAGGVSTGDVGGGNLGGDVFGGGYIAPSEIIQPELIKAYPNPTFGQGQIQIPLEHRGDLQIDIKNIAGSVIQRKSFADLEAGFHQFPFDLTKNGSGVYYFSIAVNNQLVHTLRLIVI